LKNNLKMDFKKFNKRKKPNYKRGIILVLLLFVIVYFWMHADEIIRAIFSPKS